MFGLRQSFESPRSQTKLSEALVSGRDFRSPALRQSFWKPLVISPWTARSAVAVVSRGGTFADEFALRHMSRHWWWCPQTWSKCVRNAHPNNANQHTQCTCSCDVCQRACKRSFCAGETVMKLIGAPSGTSTTLSWTCGQGLMLHCMYVIASSRL